VWIIEDQPPECFNHTSFLSSTEVLWGGEEGIYRLEVWLKRQSAYFASLKP
jgi:hypothetical protein